MCAVSPQIVSESLTNQGGVAMVSRFANSIAAPPRILRVIFPLYVNLVVHRSFSLDCLRFLITMAGGVDQ